MSLAPNASQARKTAVNELILHNETTKIEEHIIVASDNGLFTVSVSNTLMTTPGTSAANEYYIAWKNPNPNISLREQMNTVINYFEDRGYVINRVTDNNSLNSFIWVIRW